MKADAYFASMSPMADKVQMDVLSVSLAFEPLWSRFTLTEQSDAINNRLIQPDIVLRYARSQRLQPHRHRHSVDNIDDDDANVDTDEGWLYDDRRLATFARQRTGFKRVPADGSFDYRDEHSRPFAWKTKSQLWLNVFDDDGTLAMKSTTDQKVATETKLNHQNDEAIKMPIDADLAVKVDAAAPVTPLQFNHSVAQKQIYVDGTSTQQRTGRGGTASFLHKFISTTKGSGDNDDNDDEMRLMDDGYNTSDNSCPNSISLCDDGKECAATSATLPGKDDDCCGELNQLLNEEKNDLKTTYDFLNNW